MSKVRLSHIIDEDIAGKFTIALNLSGEDADTVIEELMRGYIVRTFSETANFYTPLAESTKEEDMYHGKANQRIPSWAQKPNQYNHKIIRAFFAASNGGTTALLTEMEKLMGKKTFSEVLGPLVIKPEGKLTLVPESDKREAVTANSAKEDFQMKGDNE